MKITKISAQQRPGRYNVYLDDKFFIGASEETLIKHGLKIDLELTPIQAKKIKRAEDQDKFWQRSLGYLSYRPRSKQEVKIYLRRKDCSDKLSQTIIKRLVRLKLLNDVEFAKTWIKDRQVKLKGPRLIHSELIQKGINQQKIEPILNKWYNQDQERLIAKQAFQKKAKGKKLSFDKQQKITQYLMRRGFNYGIIKEIIQK